MTFVFEFYNTFQFSAEKLSARGADHSAVILDEHSDNSPVSSSDAQNDQSDPDGTENPPSGQPMNSIQPSADPQIRHIWSEAIDLADVRNGDDQAEFRSLLIQLGIDQISSATLTRYNIRGHMVFSLDFTIPIYLPF